MVKQGRMLDQTRRAIRVLTFALWAAIASATFAGCEPPGEFSDICPRGHRLDDNGGCGACLPGYQMNEAGLCLLSGTVDGGFPNDGGTDGDPTGACQGRCTDAAPFCLADERRCVACRSNADCEGDTPFCSAEGECVGCTQPSHCTDAAASQCDLETNACVACETSEHCAHITGAHACDEGLCVECTPETEAKDCGEYSCDPATHTCGPYKRASRVVCEACVSDSDCEMNHRCVGMTYAGVDRPGGYCLRTASAGCENPFSVPTGPRTSLSGTQESDYCGISESVVTCEAVRALLDDVQCDDQNPCPDGGLCRTVGTLANRCTYQCAVSGDCPFTRPCGVGTTLGPKYCGG